MALSAPSAPELAAFSELFAVLLFALLALLVPLFTLAVLLFAARPPSFCPAVVVAMVGEVVAGTEVVELSVVSVVSVVEEPSSVELVVVASEVVVVSSVVSVVDVSTAVVSVVEVASTAVVVDESGTVESVGSGSTGFVVLVGMAVLPLVDV